MESLHTVQLLFCLLTLGREGIGKVEKVGMVWKVGKVGNVGRVGKVEKVEMGSNVRHGNKC